jgi:hypothetical protein
MKHWLLLLLCYLPAFHAESANTVQGNFSHQECINCHRKTDAQLVNDWQQSMHANRQPQALCTNCHGNDHATAAASSRRNDSCINCHGGATSPVVHSYTSSKHGIIMQLEHKSYDWNKPLREANYRVPGCAYCHLHNGNHLAGKSDLLHPSTEDMDRLTSACMDCHAPRYIARLNDNALRMIDIANMKAREARRLAEKQGTADAALASQLQQTEKHRRNVYLGAFHQSPDYQWWHGQPSLDGDLIRIRDRINKNTQEQGSPHE